MKKTYIRILNPIYPFTINVFLNYTDISEIKKKIVVECEPTNNKIHRKLDKIKLKDSDGYCFESGGWIFIIIQDLGDALDGQNKQTTRGGHELEQNMSTTKAFEVYVKGKMNFINRIREAKIANKSTVAPKDENPDNSFSQEIPAVPNSEHSTSIDGTYFIRVKVFSDSIPAVHFLKEVQLTIPQLSFYLNHPTNGLFEIVTENFPDKKSANRHLGLINYPEAVVIFKNNVE